MLKSRQQCLLAITLASFIYSHAEDIYCTDSRECIGQTIKGTNTFSRGYKSTFGANTSITSTTLTSCEGSFSCSGVSFISSLEITCYGSNSCSHVNSITFGSLLQCTGSNSCMSSNIASSSLRINTSLLCWGYKSCANALISRMESIDATATYAAYSATIHSGGTNLKVSFSGYHAALNTKLICGSDDICTINCFSTACYRLYIDCASCTINTQSMDTIHPIMNISNLIYPTIASEFEPIDSTLSNDDLCNIEATSVSYDDQQHIATGNIEIISNQVLCCRGERSCEQSTNITRLSAIKRNTICSGDLACATGSFIKNYGSIYCESNRGCLASKLSTSDSIYCSGKSSCGWHNTFYNALNIYCSGYYSCGSASFHTSGLGYTHHAYFIGFESAHDATYHCKENDGCVLLCGARDACRNLTVICDGECVVYCDTDSLCPKGYARNIKQGILSPGKLPSIQPTILVLQGSEARSEAIMSHGTAYTLFVFIVLLIISNVSACCLLFIRKPLEERRMHSIDVRGEKGRNELANMEKRTDVHVVEKESDDFSENSSMPHIQKKVEGRGGNAVAQCADCMQIKLGAVYEDDGEFYCLECWSYYQE